MKKIKIAFVAIAAIMGVGGAYAKTTGPKTIEYVFRNDGSGQLTDLTATERNAGFHCKTDQTKACSYTDPNLPSAIVRNGDWAY